MSASNRAKPAAYVGFDVDMTLGFFELTNPLAAFWSPEYVEAPVLDTATDAEIEQATEISARLRAKLAAARRTFAELLLNEPQLLQFVLRPNIAALFLPLLELRKAKKLGAIVLYSNTSVTYSLELAKQLIEGLFHVPGLIGAAADATHSIRERDRVAAAGPEPLKTYETLELLFQAASRKNTAKPIPKEHALFVDDRIPMHALAADIDSGLSYIVPTPFFSHPTEKMRHRILALAVSALEKVGLTENREYLDSGFCNRVVTLPGGGKKLIRNFTELRGAVQKGIDAAGRYQGRWEDDTTELTALLYAFSEKF